MGGKSTTTQTSSSTSEPWSAAQPFLHQILNYAGARIPTDAGLTENESVAVQKLTDNANAGNPYSGLIGNYAGDLLNGGGAMNYAPGASTALTDLNNRLSPVANGSNIGPNGNPALQGYLNTISSDVQNRVNGMFAGAGRQLSGSNVQQLARGIAEGTAPVLANQYNTDYGRMTDAANTLYNASNTTTGLLSGLNQTALANRGLGVDASSAALGARDSSANALLNAEAIKRGIPQQSLGLLAQIGIPIAALGQQNQGTATGTSQMSGAQQFATIGSGLGGIGKFLWG